MGKGLWAQVYVFVACVALVGPASAATYTVGQSGQTYTTVNAAFAAALAAVGDTNPIIEIQDNNGGAGYTEPRMDLTTAADRDITITATTAVTLISAGVGELFRNLANTATERKLSVIGASSAQPITLYSSIATSCISFGNTDTGVRNGLMHLENVVIEKSTTAPSGLFLRIDNAAVGQQYLSNVKFKGGPAANTSSIMRAGTANEDYAQDLYMEFVNFSEANGSQDMLWIWNRANIEARNCIFRPASGSNMPCVRAVSENAGLGAIGGSEVIFRDCQFQSDNGGSSSRDAFIELGESFHTARNVYKLYRPQFLACGTNILNLGNRPCEVYVLGLDDSDQPTVPKVNLSLVPASVLRYALLRANNKVSFQHCVASDAFFTGTKSIGSSGNVLIGSPEVELINCEFSGTGIITMDATAGSFGSVVKATNCVFTTGLFPLPFIDTDSSNTVPDQITLTNCTLTKNSGYMITADTTDLIQAPGSILDGSLGTGIAFNAAALSLVDLQPGATPALTWTSLGTSGFNNVPAGTIIAAPNLSSTGRLTINSTAAFNGAAGSAVSIDIDNESRPQPVLAAANDLGADETAFPVTDLALSNATVADEAANGVVVGSIIITDPDQDTSLTLTDDGGGVFALSGNDLVVPDTSLLNGFTTPGITIEIEGTDLGGAVYSEQFSIAVTHTPATVSSVEVIDGLTVRVTFSRAMGLSAETAANYAMSGTGQGSLSVNPDTVVPQSPTVYDLSWLAPQEMYIGGDITITAGPGALDEEGAPVGSPDNGTDLGAGVGTAPTLTILGTGVSSPTNADNLPFDLVFNEDVQGLDIADIDILNAGLGYAGANITGGPASYTITFADVTGDGTLVLALAAGATVTDLAGNAVQASLLNAAVDVDNMPPAVTSINVLDPNPTNAASVRFGVQFSEEVTGFVVGDTALVATQGVLAGASVTGVTPLAADSYEATAARGTGDVDFRLVVNTGGAIADAAGNFLAAAFTTGGVYQIRELRITAQPAAFTSATAGDTVQFTVGVTGGVLPRDYAWFYAPVSSGPFTPVPGGTNNTLELSPVTVADAGYYYVTVSDANESQGSALAQLAVDPGIPLLGGGSMALLAAALVVTAARRRK